MTLDGLPQLLELREDGTHGVLTRQTMPPPGDLTLQLQSTKMQVSRARVERHTPELAREDEQALLGMIDPELLGAGVRKGHGYP